jgi:hypothetical protein
MARKATLAKAEANLDTGPKLKAERYAELSKARPSAQDSMTPSPR